MQVLLSDVSVFIGCELVLFFSLGQMYKHRNTVLTVYVDTNTHVNISCTCAHSCPTLCDPLDSSPPGSSLHETSQGRTFPPSGDLPNPGIKSMSPVSHALQADPLPLSHLESCNCKPLISKY